MGIASVLDKAGPSLATGIVLAVLAGATSTYVAVRTHVDASDVWQSGIERAVSELRADFDGFRNPGGRFTSHDGDRHWSRMDELDRRLRDQENRSPRLSPMLDKVEERLRGIESRVALLENQLDHLESEQERLCQRLQACRGGK